MTDSNARVVKNVFEEEPTQSVEALVPQAKVQLAEDEEYSKSIGQHGYRPWVELGRLASTVARMEPADALVNIVPTEKCVGAGALATLIARPDATNTAEPANVRKVFMTLFRKKTLFQEKATSIYRAYPLVPIAPAEDAAYEAQGRSMGRNVTSTRTFGMHSASRTRLHGEKRNDIMRHMLGDFKRYSLTPMGRKDPEYAGAKD